MIPLHRQRQLASDNYAGICPEAWAALAEANHGHAPGYGDDAWTQRAADLIRAVFETKCEVFFVFNGTAANSLALAAMCQSYHSILCHEIAHIERDECGAPEFFSNGTKVLLLEGENGKVSPDAVTSMARKRTDIHFPKARVLSLTQPTEVGTVYSVEELKALCDTAHQLGLKVHMDGARFANAVSFLQVAPREISWQAGVDVLCLGATKNGSGVGEAVVFFDLDLAREFDYRCKQAGQLASKMRFLSAPWVGMLQDDAWLRHAAHANHMAKRLEEALRRLPLAP
ncbi:MAG: low specificity L-threonine aldolase, partial [Armatimonadota bacterium]|nr:low specificity L-threonine aldolase [Armatimonadota bacterium]